VTRHLLDWIVAAGEDGPYGDAALLRSMVRFEVALAQAQARVGAVPQAAADAIAQHASGLALDPAPLARAGAHAGTLVVPFVRALVAHVATRDESAARWVHHGATSQDVMDTALALCTRKALAALERDLSRASRAAASLARRHASAPMLARTLLQPAGVTTVGFKCAHWALSLARVRWRLLRTAQEALAVSLAGAAGNLAELGEHGPAVRAQMAQALELTDPGASWHSHREPWIALAADAGLACGAMAKIARDVALMAQAEVGEAREPQAAGRGASSAMPHKRNPALTLRVLAATQAVPGMVSGLLAGMVQEHERALGSWQAELAQFPQVFTHALAAAAALADLLEGLYFDVARCRANIEALHGTIFSERLAALLLPVLGKEAAQTTVADLCRGALDGGRHLRDLARERLSGDARLQPHLGGELDEVFDLERPVHLAAAQVEPLLAAAERPVP
jgi:3-carboxy-cis,cis-muconate cycloisomerase